MRYWPARMSPWRWPSQQGRGPRGFALALTAPLGRGLCLDTRLPATCSWANTPLRPPVWGRPAACPARSGLLFHQVPIRLCVPSHELMNIMRILPINIQMHSEMSASSIYRFVHSPCAILFGEKTHHIESQENKRKWILRIYYQPKIVTSCVNGFWKTTIQKANVGSL